MFVLVVSEEFSFVESVGASELGVVEVNVFE